MTRYDLTVATRLIHDGLNYRYDARRGSEVDWVHDQTRQRLTLTDEQIAEAVAEGTARLYSSSKKEKRAEETEPVPDFENLDPDERAALMRKWEYTQDLYSAGLPERPAIAQVEAVVLATAKRIQDPVAPHVRTVRRWQEKLGPQPHLGRLMERHIDKGNRDDRLHPEVRESIERLIDERYLQRPPISIKTLLDFVRTDVRHKNAEREPGDKLTIPGWNALSSAIAARNPRDVYAARHGEDAAAQKFDGVYPRLDPKAPLDLVELDHTVGDVFVVSNVLRLPIGRPTVAVAIDRCTRMPFGLYIGFEPPSVLTVMQCLRNGILPKTYLRKKIENGDWKIKNAWPVFGIPRALLVDRALENLGHDLRLNAAGLGITRVRIAPRKKPKHKGGVERFIGTLNRRLLHEQRGTTFSNVVHRGDYNPTKNAIITLDELYEQVHLYLVDIYAQSPHAGIRKDLPVRRWHELTERYPVDALEDLQEILPFFGRSEDCSLQREGARLKYIFYNSPQLAALRSSPAFLAAAGPKPRLTFRYDPADLRSVHVYVPHEKRYLEVPPVPRWSKYVQGLSIWEHETILAFERERTKGSLNADALAEAKVDLISMMDAQDALRPRSRTRKRHARLTGHGRIAPAGDDYATSPRGSTASGRAEHTTASNDDRPTPPSAIAPDPRPRQRRVRLLSDDDGEAA